jgi:hypothetical protein
LNCGEAVGFKLKEREKQNPVVLALCFSVLMSSRMGSLLMVMLSFVREVEQLLLNI